MDDKKPQNSIATLISCILLIVGFIVELPFLVSQGLIAVQQHTVRLYSVVILIGISMIVAAYVFHFSKGDHSKRQRLAAGIILVLGLSGLVYLAGLTVGSRREISDMQLLPFDLIDFYGFEDAKDLRDISPLQTLPQEEPTHYLVSDSPQVVHSGDKSLRLLADIDSYSLNPNLNFVGVGISNAGFENVKAITGWILVPDTENARVLNFEAHLMAYRNDSAGGSIGFFSETKRLSPGVWTPFVLGVFFSNTDENNIFEWDGRVDDIYLTVWTYDNYVGSIYIDDIAIYKESSPDG